MSSLSHLHQFNSAEGPMGFNALHQLQDWRSSAAKRAARAAVQAEAAIIQASSPQDVELVVDFQPQDRD